MCAYCACPVRLRVEADDSTRLEREQGSQAGAAQIDAIARAADISTMVLSSKIIQQNHTIQFR